MPKNLTLTVMMFSLFIEVIISNFLQSAPDLELSQHHSLLLTDI